MGEVKQRSLGMCSEVWNEEAVSGGGASDGVAGIGEGEGCDGGEVRAMVLGSIGQVEGEG